MTFGVPNCDTTVGQSSDELKGETSLREQRWFRCEVRLAVYVGMDACPSQTLELGYVGRFDGCLTGSLHDGVFAAPSQSCCHGWR